MSKTEVPDAVLSFLEELNANTADRLASWADMYASLRETTQEYVLSPSSQSAAYAVARLSAFVEALSSLPEEGDIRVIARKLNEVLITRPDITGLRFFVGEEATRQAVELLSRMARAEALAAATIEDATPAAGSTATGKPYLH